MNRWLKLAVKEAEKSTFRFQVGAVIFNKNQFISSGHNCANRSVKNLKPIYRHWPTSVHAEVDAILKAKCDLKGASIVVVRINKEKQLRLSAPCKHCLMYLKHVGIRKIYYTINQFPYIERLID